MILAMATLEDDKLFLLSTSILSLLVATVTAMIKDAP
jgi:hypothetical protein